MEKSEAYTRAKVRVEAKVGFYTHLIVYGGVMALLIAINLFTAPQDLWFIWPMLGWGFAVCLHGLFTFFLSGYSVVTEEMIEREMKKQSGFHTFGRGADRSGN